MGSHKKLPLAEKALLVIRNLILKGELRPGNRINLDEMSRLLNFSKTPIREAMKALIGENLVVYSAHVGYSVREVTLQEYLQLFEMQEVLETHLIRQVAIMNHLVDFKLLETLNDDLIEMIQKGSKEYLGEQNDKFHRALYRDYANQFIVETIYDIWNNVRIQRNWMYQSDFFAKNAARDHEEIIEALRCGDADKVAIVMHRHYLSGRESVLLFFPAHNGNKSLPQPL